MLYIYIYVQMRQDRPAHHGRDHAHHGKHHGLIYGQKKTAISQYDYGNIMKADANDNGMYVKYNTMYLSGLIYGERIYVYNREREPSDNNGYKIPDILIRICLYRDLLIYTVGNGQSNGHYYYHHHYYYVFELVVVVEVVVVVVEVIVVIVVAVIGQSNGRGQSNGHGHQHAAGGGGAGPRSSAWGSGSIA